MGKSKFTNRRRQPKNTTLCFDVKLQRKGVFEKSVFVLAKLNFSIIILDLEESRFSPPKLSQNQFSVQMKGLMVLMATIY